ncbi:hypothetical protein CDAR_464031 [Caerostris darwini]|uniref:Uncharacterized protein n=1 Tax=Caerostris darwini TaxID=1538125 RepID=A0AAV4VTP0_9ARAC|nr:hypothetical protein CDAR_464031 [Caerostris darwini]
MRLVMEHVNNCHYMPLYEIEKSRNLQLKDRMQFLEQKLSNAEQQVKMDVEDMGQWASLFPRKFLKTLENLLSYRLILDPYEPMDAETYEELAGMLRNNLERIFSTRVQNLEYQDYRIQQLNIQVEKIMDVHNQIFAIHENHRLKHEDLRSTYHQVRQDLRNLKQVYDALQHEKLIYSDYYAMLQARLEAIGKGPIPLILEGSPEVRRGRPSSNFLDDITPPFGTMDMSISFDSGRSFLHPQLHLQLECHYQFLTDLVT